MIYDLIIGSAKGSTLDILYSTKIGPILPSTQRNGMDDFTDVVAGEKYAKGV